MEEKEVVKYVKLPGLSDLRKQFLVMSRGQRIEKIYFSLLNEAWAMRIDLKELITEIINIDKSLLAEEGKKDENKVQA